MRKTLKQSVLAVLAGASALCLGGALICTQGVRTAHAAEDYLAFVNVGANSDASLADEALGLTQKASEATAPGTVHAGSTLFTSYAENATYTLTPGAGSHQVAVAVLAEANTEVKVAGTKVNLPAGASGETVVTATAEGQFTVEVTGKLCGVLVTESGSERLFAVSYTEGQIVRYGALLSEELENATGYYANGTSKELAIEYGDITASGGVNVNFTTVDVTGTVEGTELSVTRYLTTMPENLVYFINSGSYTVDGHYPDTADDHYAYNQTVFDYYGESLLNSGTPDRKAPSANEWGYYGQSEASIDWLAPGDATFPYNSIMYMERNEAAELGYYLPGLQPNAGYRIYIGSISHWHARTVNISFNGAQIPGQESLRINSGKSLAVFEDVKADANGKINIYAKGGSTNEPMFAFVAVQSMETEVAPAPAALQGPSTVGMEDTSVTVTGATLGAKIQMYNAAKPNQIIYEEIISEEKLAGDSYTLTWGDPLGGTSISQFDIVQITAGGASEPLSVFITDINDFTYVKSPAGYTTGAVTVTVSANADSGIAGWSYRLGQYGEPHEVVLDRPHAFEGTFTATENGDYYVVVTSGLGVTYMEIVTVNEIDPAKPVITVTPAKEGWAQGGYHVTLAVNSIAPVAEYKLYKGTELKASAASVPASVTFTEEGEYLIYVKTQAGQSAVSRILVHAEPVATVVTHTVANRTLTFSFGDTADFKVVSLSAYQLGTSGVTRMTISSGNRMDVYSAGTYVVTITTDTGMVEMFALSVTAEDLGTGTTSKKKGCGSSVSYDGGFAVAALTVAAAAVLLFKKKKA